MRRLLRLTSVVASAVAVAVGVGGLCGGCSHGARAQIILETKKPVVGLAIQGSDVAWFTDEYSLWLRASGQTRRLLWPPVGFSPFDSGGGDLRATLRLAGGNVGWLVSTQDQPKTGYIAIGVSSLPPRRATAFKVDSTDSGYVEPDTGTLITGIAASGNAILWGTVEIDLLDTPDAMVSWGDSLCDLSAGGDSNCRTRVIGGAIREWSGGTSTRVSKLPSSAAIAANGKLVAVATWPSRGAWARGYPPLGPITVSRLGGPVLARMELPQKIREMPDEMELSQQLLAVDFGAILGEILLFDVQSGRFIARVPANFSDSIAVTGSKLVLWNERRVLVIDPHSGLRTLMTTARASRTDTRATTITAVAVDGDRLAWAQTDSRGQSIVRIIRVG